MDTDRRRRRPDRVAEATADPSGHPRVGPIGPEEKLGGVRVVSTNPASRGNQGPGPCRRHPDELEDAAGRGEKTRHAVRSSTTSSM